MFYTLHVTVLNFRHLCMRHHLSQRKTVKAYLKVCFDQIDRTEIIIFHESYLRQGKRPGYTRSQVLQELHETVGSSPEKPIICALLGLCLVTEEKHSIFPCGNFLINFRYWRSRRYDIHAKWSKHNILLSSLFGTGRRFVGISHAKKGNLRCTRDLLSATPGGSPCTGERAHSMSMHDEAPVLSTFFNVWNTSWGWQLMPFCFEALHVLSLEFQNILKECMYNYLSESTRKSTGM